MNAGAPVFLNFEPFAESLDALRRRLDESSVVARIWGKDPAVWKAGDEEIGNRLGWLDAPERFAGRIRAFEAFARGVRAAGFSRVILLGMGGSSLAPEVLVRVFGPGADGLPLDILDSTDPAAVVRLAGTLDFATTLFLVSSKSGTTLETTSLLNYFFVRAADVVGRENAGARFVATTDPSSWLEGEARRLGFRAVFRGDPDIGGRFSAISAYGLLPAALLGMDLNRLLTSAREAMVRCRNEKVEDNPAALAGAVLGALALAGRDKARFVLSAGLRAFGAWLEQLVAESTGKDGRGILPLVRAAGAPPDRPADDRVFIILSLGDDAGQTAALAARGAPLISLKIESPYDLGGQFYFWEFAVAVAGSVLGINPFDQPNVALSKKKTEAALRRLKATGRPPEELPAAREDGLNLFVDEDAASIRDGLARFFGRVRAGDYAAIQAFLPPFPEVEAALEGLAARLEEKTGRPVTFAFGPRFLHSTGQLHKGDAGGGLYLQLTAAHPEDAPVPDSADGPSSSATFGELIDAQAWGDREALREKRRRLARVHIEGDLAGGIAALTSRL